MKQQYAFLLCYFLVFDIYIHVVYIFFSSCRAFKWIFILLIQFLYWFRFVHDLRAHYCTDAMCIVAPITTNCTFVCLCVCMCVCLQVSTAFSFFSFNSRRHCIVSQAAFLYNVSLNINENTPCVFQHTSRHTYIPTRVVHCLQRLSVIKSVNSISASRFYMRKLDVNL